MRKSNTKFWDPRQSFAEPGIRCDGNGTQTQGGENDLQPLENADVNFVDVGQINPYPALEIIYDIKEIGPFFAYFALILVVGLFLELFRKRLAEWLLNKNISKNFLPTWLHNLLLFSQRKVVTQVSYWYVVGIFFFLFFATTNLLTVFRMLAEVGGWLPPDEVITKLNVDNLGVLTGGLKLVVLSYLLEIFLFLEVFFPGWKKYSKKFWRLYVNSTEPTNKGAASKKTKFVIERSTKGCDEVCDQRSTKGCDEVCDQRSTKGCDEVCDQRSTKVCDEVSPKGAKPVSAEVPRKNYNWNEVNLRYVFLLTLILCTIFYYLLALLVKIFFKV